MNTASAMVATSASCVVCGDEFIAVKPRQGPTPRNCGDCRRRVRYVPRIRTLPRARTIRPGGMTRAQRRALTIAASVDARELADVRRPATRRDCLPGGSNAARPCPFATCRWHLAVDVTPSGSLKINHPGRDVEDLAATCALDIADRGGATLDEVGSLLNVARERIRQIEASALRKLQRAGLLLGYQP